MKLCYFQAVLVAVLSLSCVPLFAIPWTAAHQAPLSFTISLSLLKLTSTDLVMPSNHFILCCPLLLSSIFPSIRVFSNQLGLLIRWPKYWSFSFSISLSNEYSALISFRIDWFITLQSKALKSLSSITIRKHQFFSAQPCFWCNSHIHTYMTTGKTIALIIQIFVGKVMLCFLIHSLG